MSHWTSVKSNISCLNTLEQAAKQLSCSVTRNATARGYYNNMPAEMVLSHDVSPYDIAVNKSKNENTYTLTTDWYGGFEKIVGNEFGFLKQKYGALIAKKKAIMMGANITEEVCEDGSIKLRIRGLN